MHLRFRFWQNPFENSIKYAHKHHPHFMRSSKGSRPYKQEYWMGRLVEVTRKIRFFQILWILCTLRCPLDHVAAQIWETFVNPLIQVANFNDFLFIEWVNNVAIKTTNLFFLVLFSMNWSMRPSTIRICNYDSLLQKYL